MTLDPFSRTGRAMNNLRMFCYHSRRAVAQLWRAAVTILLPMIMLTGCLWVPSGWRSTPLDRVEKKEIRVDEAKDRLLKGAQESAHKTQTAISLAEPSRAVEVAKTFAGETTAAIDRVVGVPDMKDEAAWAQLVRDLNSENAKTRAEAEARRKSDSDRIAELGARLASADAALQKAERKALDYAAEVERIADYARKLAWVIGGVVALWALSIVLSVASKFVPALSGAASLVNMAVAPALRKAAQLPARVGAALADMEKASPKIAAEATRYLDSALDLAHQKDVRRARLASK